MSPPRTVVDAVRRYWWVHLPVILILTAASDAVFNSRQAGVAGTLGLHHLLYLASVPYVALTLLGLFVPAWRLPEIAPRRVDRLILCVVTKGTNPEIVRRTSERLRALVRQGVELVVVTDRPLGLQGELLVPRDFRTRHARYKARALEYFRQQQDFGPNDWVMHLDEESILDEAGLAACLDFCARSPFLYGQGAIFYNNGDFWRHPLIAAADCVRAGDDLAKFHLQLARIHRPIFGLHGSFLLAKGTLEDEITWDLQGSLVEDYAFAVECMRRGYGVGEVRGIVREQSPQGIVDFLRQRRRWLVGIRGLSRLSRWARLWTVLWSASPLVKMAVLMDVLLATNLPWPLFTVASFLSSTSLYLYLLGSIVQDVDRGTPMPTLVQRLVATCILFPVSYTLETLAVLWSFVSTEASIGFQVVRKSASAAS